MSGELRYERYTKDEIYRFGLRVLDYLRFVSVSSEKDLDTFYELMVSEFGYNRAARDLFNNLIINIDKNSKITLKGE